MRKSQAIQNYTKAYYQYAAKNYQHFSIDEIQEQIEMMNDFNPTTKWLLDETKKMKKDLAG